MADGDGTEKVEQPAQGGPAPAVNADEIRRIAGEAVAQYISTVEQNNPRPQPTLSTVQPDENPLKSVIDPVIRPELNRMQIGNENAQDAAIFYATNPKAIKYKDDIEKASAELIRQGHPFKREAVFAWLRGGPKFKDFVREEMEEEKNKINDARGAETAGSGIRPAAVSKQANDATDEELRNHLKDITF